MLEKTLESPLDCKEIQPVHPKGDQSWINSLEGLMLKLKLQYFGHLMWRVDSLEKILMLGGMGAGGEGDDRGWDGWMASPTQWTWVWVNSGSWWWIGKAWRAVVHGVAKSRTWLSDWTELNWEELKDKHTETNNTIIEIKNTLEGINSIISEAEERISGLVDKMVDITSEKL